ncbi:tryptophan 2,3-dioxygenase family protein [Halobacteriovorax sp. GB3]|uniref:tryptophan 2,3-dioxygenase family protein n=1 Tax=Halobacteriovorax sp. GB3 TaxID=2719615 RepID=UPI0023626F1F|nr:tryptophan 2,3-dioxygenase family protein [Halobacteriovorax sp. GB3]MDD0854522.1 tryptophan 2,3-dioxygenase family protein [Halobacteriovorax sp. GB3]
MTRISGPTYYGDYLELNKLLDSQHPKSKEIGNEAHDETLFIIVHQVYELWFKQILHEMKSVQKIFNAPNVDEKDLSSCVFRLERIKKIQGLLLGQLEVMETMTPMDFLEFRDLLVPASGFQSVQFRQIEIMMGLKTDDRMGVDREYFLGRLDKKDQKELLELEKEESLLKLVENWLERMPFTTFERFDFWKEFESTVNAMFDEDENVINENLASLSESALKIQLDNLDATRNTFNTLLDENLHKQLILQGKRKLSRKATLNALFILLYRSEPILHLPFVFLRNLMDIDENFTTWRYKHAIMAHRMLGTKIGTGGSSGHAYLKRAADTNRVYMDLFNLSTFIIPKSKLPVLPNELENQLGFHFRG